MWPGSFYSTLNQPILWAGIKGNWNFYSLSNSTISSNALHQQDYCTHIYHTKQKDLWLLGDRSPIVSDRKRNRETQEYEGKGTEHQNGFSFLRFIVFFLKNGLLVSSAQK